MNNTKLTQTSTQAIINCSYLKHVGFIYKFNSQYCPNRPFPYRGIKPLSRRFYASVSNISDPFSAPIPVSYIRHLGKPFLVFFRVCDLDDINTFINKIESSVPISSSYIAFLKLRYFSDTFCMCGKQFAFDYKSQDQIVWLHEIVNSRIANSYDVYNMSSDDIVYIQIAFRKLDVKLLSDFVLDKTSIVSKNMVNKEVAVITSTCNIPVSTNETSLGTPLKVEFVDNIITFIYVTINHETFNFLDKILSQAIFLPDKHNDKITSFDSSFKFYLIYINRKYYVLATKYIDNNKVIKISYFLNGVVDKVITDTLLPNNVVSRIHGNTEFLIENNKVTYSKQALSIRPIDKPKITFIAGEDSNIGVLDLETFKDTDDMIKVYAAGFKTNLVENPVIYYLEVSQDPRDLIINLINELFRSVYNKTTFYCHNFGRYDLVYIINALHHHNDKCDRQEISDTKYNMTYIFRDKDIIKITISKEVITTSNRKQAKPIGTRIAKLVICDSISLLNNNLEDLAKSYAVKTQKGIFPYKFATRSNLYYIGNTPDKSYFKLNVKQSRYDDIISSNWSFKDETVKYLQGDLNSLHEVITKANKQVFLDYKVNMIESLTISGLALKIFRRNYYQNNIPLINKTSMYRDIKQGYYGAITEVYKPYGEKLYYYDVNSLYPYVALQDLPGTECYKENFIDLNMALDSLFGFYYCSIESPKDKNSYLGLLPVRDKDGLRFPLGKWEGWYFSEELKFAKNNGYIIKVIRGYSFSRSTNVFKEFVKDIYKIKTNPVNDTQKQMAKSILNNLLGRFGIRLEKSVTKVLSRKTFDILSTRKAIISEKDLGNDRLLVTYLPMLDIELISTLGLDIAKIASKQSDEEKQDLDVVSVAISAAITAYGRIHISKLKMDVMKMGGSIYYSDTDSLVTDILLPENMVSSNELGLLKLEHVVIKAIFNNNKTYWLLVRDKEGELMVINKALGYSSNSLDFQDHLSLLIGKDVYASKVFSKIHWEKGYVTIDDNKGVKVNADGYKGRSKVYDSSNLWIDTKPLFIPKPDVYTQMDFQSLITNTTSKSLVVYKANHSLVLYKVKSSQSYNISPGSVEKICYHKFKPNDLKIIYPYKPTRYLQHLYSTLGICFLALLGIVSIILSDDLSDTDSELEFILYDMEDQIDKDMLGITEVELPSSIQAKPIKEEAQYEFEAYEDYQDNEINQDVYIEKTPSTDKTELIKRGGFIDTISDADDLGLTRLFDVDSANEKPCSDTPSTTTTLNESSTDRRSVAHDPNDKFSPFTPVTLDYLKDEIRKNEENVGNLEEICKDPEILADVREKLLDERKYYLSQHTKHMDSVLNQAKSTDLNDIDADRLIKEIEILKDKIDKLSKDSEAIKSRKLEDLDKEP